MAEACLLWPLGKHLIFFPQSKAVSIITMTSSCLLMSDMSEQHQGHNNNGGATNWILFPLNLLRCLWHSLSTLTQGHHHNDVAYAPRLRCCTFNVLQCVVEAQRHTEPQRTWANENYTCWISLQSSHLWQTHRSKYTIRHASITIGKSHNSSIHAIPLQIHVYFYHSYHSNCITEP